MGVDRSAAVEALCRSYLAALEAGDLEAVLANFTDDATATSPISGRRPVRDFYAYVMRVTSGRAMALRTIFVGVSDPNRAAVHVNYTRSVGNAPPATIEVVDVFELIEDLSKFTAVTIIYDTAPIRSDFETLDGKTIRGDDEREAR